jgi:hypothetical protein
MGTIEPYIGTFVTSYGNSGKVGTEDKNAWKCSEMTISACQQSNRCCSAMSPMYANDLHSSQPSNSAIYRRCFVQPVQSAPAETVSENHPDWRSQPGRTKLVQKGKKLQVFSGSRQGKV